MIKIANKRNISILRFCISCKLFLISSNHLLFFNLYCFDKSYSLLTILRSKHMLSLCRQSIPPFIKLLHSITISHSFILLIHPFIWFSHSCVFCHTNVCVHVNDIFNMNRFSAIFIISDDNITTSSDLVWRPSFFCSIFQDTFKVRFSDIWLIRHQDRF